jgi:hypothetical protein
LDSTSREAWTPHTLLVILEYSLPRSGKLVLLHKMDNCMKEIKFSRFDILVFTQVTQLLIDTIIECIDFKPFVMAFSFSLFFR